MKEYILKVSKDLENGLITEDKARKLLLGLFGINGVSQPLTVQNVNKMLIDCSKKTWIAYNGTVVSWRLLIPLRQTNLILTN